MEKRPFFEGEDSTKYGEFIATFDAWIPKEEQKKRANHLENNTKTNHNEQILPE